MKDKNVLLLITISLLVAMLTSSFILYKRVKTEKLNDSVELIADYSDIERMASFEKVSINKILEELKNAGIGSIAVTEDLVGNTDINILSGVDPKKINLYIQSKGLSSAKINIVKAAGLRVIPRVRNSLAMTSKSIDNNVGQLNGYDTVIFAEEEVLGYPNYLKETAAALRTRKIKYGYIEFGKQLGDSGLAAYSGENIVKVHSIAVDEMEKLSNSEMRERFLRAVRERSLRSLYVHLLQYPDKGSDLIMTNIKFITELKDALTSNGYVIGKASSPENMRISKLEQIIIGAGIGAGLLLLLSYFMTINILIAVVLTVVCALIPQAKILALLSAIIFPSYAVISQFPVKRDQTTIGAVSTPILMVINIAACAVLGAVFIASLLVGSKFMLAIDSFSGVKLAFVLPIFIVGAYFFLRDEKGEIKIKGSLSKVIELLNINITLLHVAVLAIVAAAAAIMILRSGNFGLPVPGVEKLIRGLLENALSVRPRTKEFLIGYPALVLASIYYLRGGEKWLWAFLVVGILAPISMTNSFCHIHTPLLITVVRSCIGLILGIASGLLAYFVYFLSIKAYNYYNK
jgi:hypothetical protein